MSDEESNDETSVIEKTPVRRKRPSEDTLLSLDKLDSSPPDLWPEKNSSAINTTPMNSSPPSWTKGLSQDDLNAMHQLGCLSVNGIFAELRKIYDKAYQLGVVEKQEMTRGKQIGIFSNVKKKPN